MNPTQKLAWLFIASLCVVALAYYRAGFLD